ncbi:MAG: response regulator [Candidatus Saccharimonadales bacterium]
MIKILLIEDDRWLADSYMHILEQYEMDSAIDGYEAMDLIDINEYELIIADVLLERGMVFDLLHELQSYTDTASIPIILCTNLAQRIKLEDVKKYGVIGVLDKSTLTPKILQETVEQAVE